MPRSHFQSSEHDCCCCCLVCCFVDRSFPGTSPRHQTSAGSTSLEPNPLWLEHALRRSHPTKHHRHGRQGQLTAIPCTLNQGQGSTGTSMRHRCPGALLLLLLPLHERCQTRSESYRARQTEKSQVRDARCKCKCHLHARIAHLYKARR